MPSCFPWCGRFASRHHEPRADVKTTKWLKLHSKRINQYRKGVKVGSGKHGDVYCCGSETTNEVVAIKIVKRSGPRDRLRLLRRSHQSSASDRLGTTEHSIRKEIAIMKACHHIHLVQLLEVIDDPTKDKICLVMEYLSGGQVQWADEHSNPLLFLDQTRRIMRDVIVGLEYLHYHGIIHRDIKPANLMWSSDRSTVKIIDFGVSQFVPAERQAPTPTGNGQYEQFKALYDPLLFPTSDLLKRIGTPAFLAPEVVWFFDPDKEASGTSSDTLTSLANEITPPTQRPPITKAIDVWSLAVTFYCLLFGRTPFTVPPSQNHNPRHSEFVLYNMICTHDWDVIETMGAELLPTGGRHPKDPEHEGYAVINLLDQMLQKDPRRRPTLQQIKRHPWLLRDIVNPKSWLRDTAPFRAPPPSLGLEWFRRVTGR